MTNKLDAELEYGNVEYKWRLDPSSPDRFDHLVTQLKWRLSLGFDEAVYEIGVADDGSLRGLQHDELQVSLANLHAMAHQLGARVNILRETDIGDGLKIVEALVRKHYTSAFDEVRVATVGDHEAGKSTLLGVITQGGVYFFTIVLTTEPDNGRGKARVNIFKHRHEIETGHTSTIATEILGFNKNGHPLNYSTNLSPQEIVLASSKVVTWIDCCGLPNYTKHTIRGLTGHSPDYACAMIPANSAEISTTTREHLSICLALDLPLFLIITKLDITTKLLLQITLSKVYKLLHELNKIPLPVHDQESLSLANCLQDKKSAPIFFTSSVSKSGFPLLYSFLHSLEKPPLQVNEHVFQIEQVYHLPSGIVVAGINKAGQILLNDKLWIGPCLDTFVMVTVNSIHRQRVPSTTLDPGQSGAMSISFNEHVEPRKGMVLLHTKPSTLLSGFQIDARCLSGSLGHGCHAVAHCGSVRAPVQVVSISSETSSKLLQGQSAPVRFDFINTLEWISLGLRVLVVSGHTKVSGTVTSLYNRD